MTYSQAPSTWCDFNDAPAQMDLELIPKGTLVKVRMTLQPGGFDDPALGWTGGWATESTQTGSVYLSAEFVVLEGQYAKRKIWSMIGLYSPKGDEWGNMGRAFIRGVLNSAYALHPTDLSDAARQIRRIQSFGQLDGLVFVARIDVERDSRGDSRNVIKHVIEPDHKAYQALMAIQVPGMATSPPTLQQAHPSAGYPGGQLVQQPLQQPISQVMQQASPPMNTHLTAHPPGVHPQGAHAQGAASPQHSRSNATPHSMPNVIPGMAAPGWAQ